jgi:DNA-binding MurR/RpiR family transcriptional regulator
VRTLATAGSDSISAIGSVLAVHEEVLANLASADLRERLAEAVSVLLPANGIAVFGIGQTAPLASYAALLLNRVGRQTRLCNHSGIALADQLLALRSGDVVLAMAYGAAYPEIEAVFQTAADLGVPVVLVSDSLDERLASQARVVVPARRGRSGEVGLHAATLAALEAIVMGLSAGSPQHAIATLLNLGSLRNRVRGRRHPSRRARTDAIGPPPD